MFVGRKDIWLWIVINVTTANHKVISTTRITNTIEIIKDRDIITEVLIEETIVEKEDITLISI